MCSRASSRRASSSEQQLLSAASTLEDLYLELLHSGAPRTEGPRAQNSRIAVTLSGAAFPLADADLELPSGVFLWEYLSPQQSSAISLEQLVLGKPGGSCIEEQAGSERN